MRRSPTSPLILKRRKLPFHQNATDSQPGESRSKEPSKPAAAQCFPGGIRIMDHPSMSDTQVVVIPETAEVQSVIGALTAKGNECGAQGPKKFILLSGSGSGNKWDFGPDSQSAAEGAATRSTDGHKVKAETTRNFPVNKDVTCNPLDDSLTDMQWLGKMSTCILEPNSTKHLSSKENQNPLPQTFQNKFILLSGSASVNMWDFGPDSQSAAEEAAATSTEGHKVKAETTRSFPVNKDVNYGPLDDSLGRMSTCDLEPNSTKQLSSKENQNPSQTFQAHDTHTSADAPQQPISERPPYSYMAMIQFAINSRKNRRMTLKEIYMWIEDNFPYYRDVAKPGWKNSIRHNLSLHDMFIRETSPDGKMSFWTIRPEANRCLTLDHVYKEPSSNHTQAALNREGTKKPRSTKRGHFQMEEKHQLALRKKMKPLPLQTDSCFVPIQLPVTPSVYLPSTSCSQQKGNNSRAAKRVRIAPKVTQSDSPAVMISPQKNTDFKVEVKEELVCVPIKCETPKAPPKRQASRSQRKQRFVHPVNEEPVLLCHENNFFDSGVASDASTFHFTLSTPSKPPSYVASFKVTPVGKGSQNILHLSPICAPGGPTVTPQHDNTTFSFSSTPFKDLPLFNSPRELFTSAPSRVTGPAESPTECLKSSCSRELLQGGGSTAANRSITEGLVLDTMNDSLSKILLDISFARLDDDNSGMANISWSDLIPQLNTDTI